MEQKNLEHQQQVQASKLINQIRREKMQRQEQQRQKAQSILEKQLNVMAEAANRIHNYKSGNIEFGEVISTKPQAQLPSQRGHYQGEHDISRDLHYKQSNLLQQQKLKWKPKVPLYKELEQQFQKQQQASEIQFKHKLFEIKLQHKPLDKSEINHHQKVYDEMLRERAAKVSSRNMFSSPPRKSSIEPVTDRNYDLDEVLNQNSSSNKKKKLHQKYQQLATIDSKIVNDFQRDKSKKFEKGEKRQNYSKYVKEINLPMELDRQSIRKEAQKMRLKPAAINNLMQDQVYGGAEPMKTTFGRNESQIQNENERRSLPPIQGSRAQGSVGVSPVTQNRKRNENPYKTPQKQRENWAQDFLQNKNNHSNISKREKIDFVMSRANELEDQALRMQKKIELKNKQAKASENFGVRAQELLVEQQEAGDKLVDAIRAKLALLDEI